MKRILFTLVIVIASFGIANGQDCGGYSLNKVMDDAVLVFEGRVLSDSVYFQNPPGIVATYHRVLVLKQFKGSFISDTLAVVNFGGRMVLNGHGEGGRPAYVKSGDEALFFVSNYWSSDFYFIGYGDGCGFVKICDKKDLVKEIYEPIEAVTGQSYVDIHPNKCATQKQQKNNNGIKD